MSSREVNVWWRVDDQGTEALGEVETDGGGWRR